MMTNLSVNINDKHKLNNKLLYLIFGVLKVQEGLTFHLFLEDIYLLS